jgi:hypothetical protein
LAAKGEECCQLADFGNKIVIVKSLDVAGI